MNVPARAVNPAAKSKHIESRCHNRPGRNGNTCNQIQAEENVEEPLPSEKGPEVELEPGNKPCSPAIVILPTTYKSAHAHHGSQEVEQEQDDELRPSMNLAVEELVRGANLEGLVKLCAEPDTICLEASGG